MRALDLAMEYTVLGVLSAIVFVYLLYVLVRPEKF